MAKILLGLMLFSVQGIAELMTVPYVDLGKYAGTWYQIARNPVFFENGCVCSRQVLSPNPDGSIGVYNSCNDQTVSGPLEEIRGTAEVDNPGTNSKLTVDFGLPFKGTYWVIGLDSDYRYAVVSEPRKSVLYILSKTPSLDPVLYDEALALAAAQLDTSRLTRTLQEGCQYP
jgi:apolipoprotein D and lipocalin family protein